MKTRSIVAAAIVAIALTSAVETQELPSFDIVKGCETDSLRPIYCVAREERIYELLKRLWNRASTAVKEKCLTDAESVPTHDVGRKYTILTGCLISAMRIEESSQARARAR
jgi:hypothetical protein